METFCNFPPILRGKSRGDLLCYLFKDSKIRLNCQQMSNCGGIQLPVLLSGGKECSPSPSLLKLVVKLLVTSLKSSLSFQTLESLYPSVCW